MSENPKKILIACRQQERRFEIAQVLKYFHGSVDMVSSGIQGLKCMERRAPYDLLITELFLDEISGFALIIAAQKNAETRVICINNGNSLLRLIADEFKVDQILDDPIDLKELGNILTSYLKPYFMLQRAALPKVKTLSD